MRLTVKGTVRSMVIITVKGMSRITVKGMVRINGKCIVMCMVIITVKGTVTLLLIPALCISHVVAPHHYQGCLPTLSPSPLTCCMSLGQSDKRSGMNAWPSHKKYDYC